MLNKYFANPTALAFFGVLLLMALIAVLAVRKRRRAIRFWPQYSTSLMSRWRILRFGLLAAGIALLVVGIAGPRWGKDEPVQTVGGRDVVVVFDVSRSMFAQDVLPSRLERAKEALEQLSRTIEKRGGHRLALVLFASRARVVCPLTHDYDHFRTALAEIDAKDIPAELRATNKVDVSGTRIGAGLTLAVEALDAEHRGFQDVLLISDGDDPGGDGEWQAGVADALSQAVPVHTVGVGDPVNAVAIPDRQGWPLRHNNIAVLSRLEERPLEEIARFTNGVYVPARTGRLTLDPWFFDQIAAKPSYSDQADALSIDRHRYPWFFGLALLLLGSQMVFGERGSKLRPRQV